MFLTTVSSFVPQEQEQQGNGRQHQVPPPCRLESKPQQQQLMSSGILALHQHDNRGCTDVGVGGVRRLRRTANVVQWVSTTFEQHPAC